MTNWINKKSNISYIDIEVVEDKFNIKFPPDFKEFILNNNGAEPILKTIRFQEEIETVKSLISFSTNDDNYIMSIYKDVAGFLPSRIVPFAETNCIDLICFDFRGSNYSIVYWNYDFALEVAFNEMKDGEQVYEICKTFEKFLSMLT